MDKKKVIIVGGGFGGVNACKALAKDPTLEIEIIDRRNYHLFQPLLYQVAMAGLNPADIAVPIRGLFKKNKNVNVTLAEVRDIDLDGKRIQYDDQWHQFDYLILACGVKHFYFGNNDWENFAPGLKNIEQATEIRRRILTAFELAEKSEKENADNYLNFVIVGGGPTGVELAGALGEMSFKTLKYDYKKANLNNTRIILVEAGERILSSFPESLSAKASLYLESLGVEVRTKTMASELNEEGLDLNGENFACKTIIWAAGVKPSGLTNKVSTSKDKQGRLIVQKDLSIEGHPEVFVIGDQSSFIGKSGAPLPGVAQVALQQGHSAGKNIIADLRSKPRKEFIYKDKGNMATVGRSKAIIHAGPLKLSGLIAWLIWAFVHVAFLARFKNRVFVFLHWTWSYFSFGRGARLIVHKSWRFYSGKAVSYKNKSDD